MFRKEKKPKTRMAGDRISFGAGNITGPRQSQRQPEQVSIGDPRSQGQMMQQDLSGGYLNLAIPGSPLTQMALTATNDIARQQQVQRG